MKCEALCHLQCEHGALPRMESTSATSKDKDLALFRSVKEQNWFHLQLLSYLNWIHNIREYICPFPLLWMKRLGLLLVIFPKRFKYETKQLPKSLTPASFPLSHTIFRPAGEAALFPPKPPYESSNLFTPSRCLWAHHPWHPNRTLGGVHPAAAGWSWYRKEKN